MNNSKTEIIVYCTSRQLANLGISHINIDGVDVKCVDCVKDLGSMDRERVWMENTLNI